MWTCALLFVGGFAAYLLAVIVEMGWFSEAARAAAPFGVAPVELSPVRVGLALSLFVASHEESWRVRRRSSARCEVGLAWSLALCLAIAGIGFSAVSQSSHAPRQHPLEWWVYFAASAVAIGSHGARARRGQRARKIRFS